MDHENPRRPRARQGMLCQKAWARAARAKTVRAIGVRRRAIAQAAVSARYHGVAWKLQNARAA
jgi:hypothetical protein